MTGHETCKACGARLPEHTGRRRPLERCANERCKFIMFAHKNRARCTRRPNSLPLGKAYQRLAICMTCILETSTLLGATAHP